MSFNPESITTFRFGDKNFNANKGEACFEFFLDEIRFKECLYFDTGENANTFNESQLIAIENSLDIASAFLGISYYKAAAPKHIDDSALSLNDVEARFIENLWLNGLGEFAHINRVNLADRIKFDGKNRQNAPIALEQNNRVLIPIGGGKDSMVTLEELRQNFEVSAYQLGDYAAINHMVETARVPMVQVIRKIDPKLFELNQQGALNGHIPITSIYSITAVMAAILSNHCAIALSAERSADEANLTENGREVNHQWSKGYSFEQGFQALVHNRISPNIDYFSWLRPYSEFDIARKFSGLTQYHHEFSSCNRSFHLEGTKINGKWCANCPKCRFVFLILSPWVDAKHLIDIFGVNMLDDETQRDGFASLFGINGHKPFECVGEKAESALALHIGTRKSELANAKLTQSLLDQTKLSQSEQQKLLEFYLMPSEKHLIPQRFLSSCA